MSRLFEWIAGILQSLAPAGLASCACVFEGKFEVATHMCLQLASPAVVNSWDPLDQPCGWSTAIYSSLCLPCQ